MGGVTMRTRNMTPISKWKLWSSRLVASFLLMSLFSAPAAMAQTGSQEPVKMVPDDGGLLIGSGDLLDVRVFNTPELSGKFRVSPSGTITVPQGGLITVAGLSPAEAQEKIETTFKNRNIMLEPHVIVFVEEYASAGVIVLGEVAHPGTYTLLGEHSLYGALAAAGGVTANEGGSITVSHQNEPGHDVLIKVHSPNFSDVQRATRVAPGDTVFVSKADLVYLVGDVGHPGSYNMPNGTSLNLLQLLALGQGLNHTAALSKASIVRDTGESVVTIPIDLGNQKDRLAKLQPSDIVVIPRSGFKGFLDNFIPNASISILGAVTAALIVR
jgi:polysaccharide export outer membrane protein